MSARLTSEEGAALLALARAAIEERLFEHGALTEARKSVAITPALGQPMNRMPSSTERRPLSTSSHAPCGRRGEKPALTIRMPVTIAQMATR